MKALTIRPGKLTLAQLRDVYQHPVTLTLDDNAYGPIQQSVACVERIVEENRTTYGINTGFGLLASTRIARDDLENLQRSIVLSHAAGVGEPTDDNLVRLIMVLKINSLSRGFSGIRLEVGDRSAGQSRPETADAGGERGPGAAERHPSLRRLRAARPVRCRRSVRRCDRGGQSDGGSGAGLSQPVRCAYPRGARPARPDRRRPRLSPPARRAQRSLRLAPQL